MDTNMRHSLDLGVGGPGQMGEEGKGAWDPHVYKQFDF